ncbi:MAG: hypothetical protein JSS41_04035 [Proteobacteria bacterium]|nr:hypothetical protein [Pseudomonadota bacterium]MBS0463991.1 hypothetical protein [Pseudomonadota bacterium]
MQAESLARYAARLAGLQGPAWQATEVFAKILTTNDDSGRHGVLIPGEAYSFLPELPIPDPARNATVHFDGYDANAGHTRTLGWKYYQRYPERRITRLNPALNDTSRGMRLLLITRTRDPQGRSGYVTDVCIDGLDPLFNERLSLVFAEGVPRIPGAFVRLPVEHRGFVLDDALQVLLAHFDRIRDLGWVTSMRAGDTGIGYTFESLVGIRENNDPDADFRGIEIKCKLKRNVGASGKINLFQQGPRWAAPMTARDRLRLIGQRRPDGLYACYSQVTTEANNLDLMIDVERAPGDLRLRKGQVDVGAWTREILAGRLKQKHQRAVFIKADRRASADMVKYRYTDVIYCEQPHIERFIDMVSSRRIAFEFTMAERANGRVRNHGYPWRLMDESMLEQLFALQIQLRGEGS